jgi:hypothetical protein
VNLQSLRDVFVIPSSTPEEWLLAADEGPKFLAEATREIEIIVHVSLSHGIVHSVFVPNQSLPSVDKSDLLRCNLFLDHSWAIEHVWGGGEPERVYLSDPLDGAGCKSLSGGEKIIFNRNFDGVKQYRREIEVSQKLVHALDLYWLDEQSAFCRLDDNGDIEPVIRIWKLDELTFGEHAKLVTITARQLHRYMAAGDYSLVQKFDFTRVVYGSFFGWHNQNTSFEEPTPDLFYNLGSQANGSYANGVNIIRHLLTKQDLMDEFNRRLTDEDKEYASFLAYDWKNSRISEISCAPSALASYFEKESKLPFQVTPAFFRPEVLQRYKNDREKYTLEHRSIHSRAGWYLKSYGVNEEGQVHAYLYDLANLPYSEQLYWKAFNEPPKASISKRAYKTDILGEWDEALDPLLEIKHLVSELDKRRPDWWSVRGEECSAAVHYPLTESVEEWAESLLSLDQLVIEGFHQSGLRQLAEARDIDVDKTWQSLRLLEHLIAKIDTEEAADKIRPLKELHHLRSKVKGHRGGSERKALIQKARNEHGSLKEHFKSLNYRCLAAIEFIFPALEAKA